VVGTLHCGKSWPHPQLSTNRERERLNSSHKSFIVSIKRFEIRQAFSIPGAMFLGTLRQPTRFSGISMLIRPSPSPSSLLHPQIRRSHSIHQQVWKKIGMRRHGRGRIWKRKMDVALDVPVSRVCELRIPHVKLLDG